MKTFQTTFHEWERFMGSTMWLMLSPESIGFPQVKAVDIRSDLLLLVTGDTRFLSDERARMIAKNYGNPWFVCILPEDYQWLEDVRKTRKFPRTWIELPNRDAPAT